MIFRQLGKPKQNRKYKPIGWLILSISMVIIISNSYFWDESGAENQIELANKVPVKSEKNGPVLMADKSHIQPAMSEPRVEPSIAPKLGCTLMDTVLSGNLLKLKIKRLMTCIVITLVMI